MKSIRFPRPRDFVVAVWGMNLAAALLWALQTAPPATIQALPSSEERRIVDSLPRVPPGLNDTYSMATMTSRTISGAYTYTVQAPNLSAREWIMFIPKPPDLPGQIVRNARTSPEGTIVHDLSPRQQPLFRARVPVNEAPLRHEISFQLLFDAQLFSRRLITAASPSPDGMPVEPLSEQERWLSLRPTRQLDYPDKSIAKWAVKAGLPDRAAKEGEIDFARRVFEAIAETFQYEYRTNQNRSASQVVAAGKSDCGGLCNLFVAILRAHGIPARTLAGRWAISARPGQRIGEVAFHQEHIKAEFFAQGVGWVPADLSSAVQRAGLQQKSRFFGNDPGNFVTIHLDGDITFDTLYFGNKTMDLLQRASYWATGSGNFAGVVISEDWLVR